MPHEAEVEGPRTQGEQLRGGIETVFRSPVTLGEQIFNTGSPTDPSQFTDMNFGGVSRSPEATKALTQAVAQQRLGTDAAGAYIDPSTGEARYPGMGWAMQQVPGLEQEHSTNRRWRWRC